MKTIRYGKQNRRTEVYENHRFHFSYNTIVGYEGEYGNMVTKQRYSTITSKHISQFNLRGYEPVPFDELNRLYVRVRNLEEN